ALDNLEELILLTHTGIVALDTEGNTRWQHPPETGENLSPKAPLAAWDADHDGRPELYTLLPDAVVCVDGEGRERWRTAFDAAATGHLIAADLENDAGGEIVVASANRLAILDAAFGDVISTIDFSAPVSAMAAGDLDRVAPAELVAALATGEVVLLHEAEVVRSFSTGIAAPSALLTGDVNGDTELEIVVAGQQGVHIIGSTHQNLSVTATLGACVGDLRAPNTIALVSAGATTLAAYALGGTWWPMFQHWPQPRNNAAQTGAWTPQPMTQPNAEALSAYAPSVAADTTQTLVQANEEILPEGSFENDSGIIDWSVIPESSVTRATDVSASGTASLQIPAHGEPVRLASRQIQAIPEWRTISASLLVKGVAPLHAEVIWFRDGEIVATHPLRRLPVELPGGWVRYTLNPVPKPGFPSSDYQVQFRLEAEAANEPLWIDEVRMMAATERIPTAELRINQVAYELAAPKAFVAHCNFEPRDATFRLVDGDGVAVYRGTFQAAERISGAFKNDWDGYFMRGDFSPCNEKGRYFLEAEIDGLSVRSSTFKIEYNGIWESTIDAAVMFFHSRRPANTTGLWTAAATDGDPVEIVWDLVCAYDAAAVQFRKHAPEGTTPALLDEILWAGGQLRARWAEPGTRTPAARFAAIFARLLRVTGDQKTWRNVAEEALAVSESEDGMQDARFCAALDLYLATREDQFADLAHSLYPGPSVAIPESIAYYDGEFENLATFQLAGRMSAEANSWLSRASSAFGVCTQGAEGGNFFGTPPNPDGDLRGNSTYILEAAAAVAQAYRFNPRPEYLAFMYDQLNWVLGANPLGICLMAGKGDTQPASFAGSPITGGIVNGIRAAAPGQDEPAFDQTPDERTNGFSLRANAAWIRTLASLKRIPMAEPK
ncbi:MAG: glycoside hydrolase family 9 protein, partial [Candidatus Hydrogenedentes bacterium]|nr:glycoside hydrolase family 9 protein [Candidatus Hydrogenedentota bacterium]